MNMEQIKDFFAYYWLGFMTVLSVIATVFILGAFAIVVWKDQALQIGLGSFSGLYVLFVTTRWAINRVDHPDEPTKGED